MAFEFKLDQSFRKGLRRLVRKQIDAALDEITGAANDRPDEAVHEARKAFKKARALLRLVRPEIGERAYRQENLCFRDAGRPLTEVRDARVLIDTLDKLCQAGPPCDSLHQRLEDNFEAARRRVLEDGNAFAQIGDALRAARDRINDWAWVSNRWSAVGKGLRRTCRQAREAFQAAAEDPTVVNLHEWRKQVKYLRYQLQALRAISPELVGPLADAADRIGQILGDDHDLAVLQQTLADAPQRWGGLEETVRVVEQIAGRRPGLQNQAMGLGRDFFRDKPKVFADRLKAEWKKRRAGPTPAEVG